MILAAPIPIPDETTLEQLMLQYTGSKKLSWKTRSYYSVVNAGRNRWASPPRGGPIVEYGVYSRGKSTLIFKTTEDTNKIVELWEVLPKVSINGWVEMKDLPLIQRLASPIGRLEGDWALRFEVEHKLTSQEIIQLVEIGMKFYSEEHLVAYWRY